MAKSVDGEGNAIDELQELLGSCPDALYACPWSADCGSLMHLAAEMGAASVITLLISKGAPTSAVDSDGKTPLHVAAENGQLDSVITAARP